MEVEELKVDIFELPAEECSIVNLLLSWNSGTI